MKAGMKCILTIIGVIVLVGIAATNADAKSPGEIWHRTYDGGNDDEAYGVAVDSGDNITVTGRSNSGVNYDYYIIKYN